MTTAHRLLIITSLLFALPLEAQEAFTIIALEGTARVQRSQKRAWEKLEAGGKLFDNDLVETFFQTKLNLQFGNSNMVILGSNSKVLLNIAPKTEDARTITEISLTLFGGGVFSKAINNCRINIYTTNAVGVMDSGSVTTVAEGKTGETGFQVLGGLIYVRNIAQQKGIELRPGLTTMIQPGKEPTAPLYITYRHVAVLKHYFGDEYISTELDASGIKPTDERDESRMGPAFTNKSREYVDEGMLKPLFSLNRIYGSILDDRADNSYFYRPIPPPAPSEQRGNIALHADVGFSAHTVSPRIAPTFSFRFGRLAAGVRLGFVSAASGKFTGGFTSPAGLLDKIDHLSLGGPADAWSVYVGALRNITFGYGLIVNNYTNLSHTNAFHPLGLKAYLRIFDELSVQGFTSDLSAPFVSGLYAKYEPSTYHLGVGYVADFNQYTNPIKRGNMRYASLPRSDTLFPDVAHDVARVHCYTVDFAADMVNHYDFELKLAVEFAQKLFGGNDGFVLRLPSFLFDVKKAGFGGGFVAESGRLLSNQFDFAYMDNRYRIKSDLRNDFLDTIITPNNMLAKKRQSFGLSLFFRINPIRGAAIDFAYKQDFTGKHTMIAISADSIGERNLPGDFTFQLKAAINDSLIKFIRYAEISLQQSHGRLFPAEGLPFFSWTFNGGYDLLTIPLLFNIAFETGGSFFYIDTGRLHNDRIKSDEIVVEIRAGITRGFK